MPLLSLIFIIAWTLSGKPLFITFTGTIESSISQLLDNRQIIFVEKELGVQLGAIISQMLENYETHPEDSLSISMDCYRILMHLSNGIHTKDLMKEPLYQRYVAPVIREIERHYDKNLTVQKLSCQVYITPQYLSRLFQKFLDVLLMNTPTRLSH